MDDDHECYGSCDECGDGLGARLIEAGKRIAELEAVLGDIANDARAAIPGGFDKDD